jgi:hypothetical protein
MNAHPPAQNVSRPTPRLVITIVLAVLSLAASIRPVWAQATAPTLGTAKSFGILAGSTVTNTGPSTIHGDLGVPPRERGHWLSSRARHPSRNHSRR